MADGATAAEHPLLSIEHVGKTYARGLHEVHVLRDVSLTVHRGEFIAVYGRVKSGKTTLLKVAAGVEPPDSGTVRFEGADLATFSRRRLTRLHQRRMGWVHRAGPESDEMLMVDYVALPLMSFERQATARKRARQALERVGAAMCASACWGSLSEAERTAVSLAQGLVRDPALLLVDDPTAGLDVIERERVVALLRAAADEGVGVVMVVPDLPAMLRAHDVRSLSGGKLLAPEPPPDGRGTLIEFPRGERSA